MSDEFLILNNDLSRFSQSGCSWGAFKAEARARLGLPTDTKFEVHWEGCAIDEPDDRILGMIAKDGDTLTLVQEVQQYPTQVETGSQQQLSEPMIKEQVPLPPVARSRPSSETASGRPAQQQTSIDSSRHDPSPNLFCFEQDDTAGKDNSKAGGGMR